MTRAIPLTFLAFFTFLSIQLSAQTEAQIKRMEEQARRFMDSLQNDPEVKKMLKEAEALDKGSANRFDTGRKRTSARLNIPVRTTTLPDSLTDTLSYTQLRANVTKLHSQLEKGLSATEKKNLAAINPAILKNPRSLGQLALLGWYKGATEEAAVLAAKTVLLPGTTTIDANNLGAILIMGGAAEKAIPILLYLLKQSPGDPMLLNNLAQAYAALGATDLAQNYISKCLQLVPKHPEANYTAARIEAAKGNKDAAIKYAETSLEGSYTEAAFSLWQQLQPPRKKLEQLLANVDLPDDFNVYKFELPRQQLLIGEGKQIEYEHTVFREAVEAASSKIQALVSSFDDKGRNIMEQRVKELQRNPLSYLKNPNPYTRPLTTLGLRLTQKFSMTDYDNELDNDLKNKLDQLKTSLQRKRASIEQEFLERSKGLECGEGKTGCAQLERLAKERCQKIDEAVLEYLRGKAEVRINWQTKKKNEALKVFFLTSQWGYMAAPEKNMAMAAYYKAADEYLGKLIDMAKYDGAEFSYCNPADNIHKTPSAFRFNLSNVDCPFELDIPMIVGKLSLNCEEASFGISAGASFKFTQNFASRQSTLSVGIGLGLEKGIELGGVEAKAGANIGQNLFISFDKQNNITDAGMRFGMGLSAGYGVKATINMNNGGEGAGGPGVDMGRNMGEYKANVGYSFGINSGFEFNEGPLKDLLAPKAEKQLNPKVNLYKK